MTLQERKDTIATVRHYLELLLDKLDDLDFDTRGVYIQELDEDLQQVIWDLEQDQQ